MSTSRLKTTRHQREYYVARYGREFRPLTIPGRETLVLDLADVCADADLAADLEIEVALLRESLRALTELYEGARGALKVCEDGRTLLQLENTSLSTQLAEVARAKHRGYPAGTCGHLGNHVTPDPSMDFCSEECEACHGLETDYDPCEGICGKAVPY